MCQAQDESEFAKRSSRSSRQGRSVRLVRGHRNGAFLSVVRFYYYLLCKVIISVNKIIIIINNNNKIMQRAVHNSGDEDFTFFSKINFWAFSADL